MQRLRFTSPELRNVPLVIYEKQRGREIVSACCPSLLNKGVRLGMPLTEARALLQPASCRTPLPRFLPDDPLASREMLRRLAWDCEAFSPLVGIEEAEASESLILDVTGCGACFGGEERLAGQLFQRMRRRGFQVRIGIAETFGAAWGVAHYRRRSVPKRSVPDTPSVRNTTDAVVIVPPGGQQRALSPLPIQSLRLSAKVVQSLNHLGIRTVSRLAALPRDSLPSRFGDELLRRLDQAEGKREELIVPERRPQPLRETWETEGAICGTELLEEVVSQLIERIAAPLREQQRGIKQLTCHLRDSDGGIARQRIELLNPSASTGYIMNLLRLQWERLSFPHGIQRICIEVKKAESLATQARTFWETEAGEASRDIGTLVEILSSRLGREAVVRARLEAEHQPEAAFCYVSCLEESPRWATDINPAQRLPFRFTRPVRLKQTPVMVDVVSMLPGALPCRVQVGHQEETIARAWGPERITTGWWRGRHFRRDYYQVELKDGRRLWIFRDLATDAWHLQGHFE